MENRVQIEYGISTEITENNDPFSTRGAWKLQVRDMDAMETIAIYYGTLDQMIEREKEFLK